MFICRKPFTFKGTKYAPGDEVAIFPDEFDRPEVFTRNGFIVEKREPELETEVVDTVVSNPNLLTPEELAELERLEAEEAAAQPTPEPEAVVEPVPAPEVEEPEPVPEAPATVPEADEPEPTPEEAAAENEGAPAPKRRKKSEPKVEAEG